MAYYVRLLTPSDEVLPVNQLRDTLDPGTSISLEAGDANDWRELVLSLDEEGEVSAIERNSVSDENSLGAAEIDEFLEDISEFKPDSAVEWLRAYLPKVKTIYAFQFLSALDTDAGRQAFSALRNEFWSAVGGISQADAEGFSNEDGYHILWQFNDHVSGPWHMGILEDGEWVHFKMDLGNQMHRRAFLDGKVPEGVSPS